MDNAGKHRKFCLFEFVHYYKEKNCNPNISLAIFILLAGDIEVNLGLSFLDAINKCCSRKVWSYYIWTSEVYIGGLTR